MKGGGGRGGFGYTPVYTEPPPIKTLPPSPDPPKWTQPPINPWTQPPPDPYTEAQPDPWDPGRWPTTSDREFGEYLSECWPMINSGLLSQSSLALRRNLIQGLQIHYIFNSLENVVRDFFFAQYFDPKNCIRIGFFVILHQSFVQLNESLKSIFKHSNLFLCGPATQLVVRPSIVQTIPNQSYGLLLLDFDSYYVKHFFANKAHLAIAGTLKMGSWPHFAILYLFQQRILQLLWCQQFRHIILQFRGSVPQVEEIIGIEIVYSERQQQRRRPRFQLLPLYLRVSKEN